MREFPQQNCAAKTLTHEQEKYSSADGSLPRPFHLSRGARDSRKGTGQGPVCGSVEAFVCCANIDRFMFDNQRPLVDAQQSYVDFDKMKVHKVVFLP